MDPAVRIELTLRLWRSGGIESFEEYVARLLELLPRHRGVLERRAAEVDSGPGAPDVLLVISFPDAPAVDGFLRDPLRADLEDLAARAIGRALIADSRHRPEIGDDHDPADVVSLRPTTDDGTAPQ